MTKRTLTILKADWWFGWFCVVLGYLLSAAIIIGGPDRWAGEDYTLLRTVPLAPYSWGVVLLVFTTILALGYQWDRLVVIGGSLCALWCFVFAGALVVTLNISPQEVGNLGPILWGALGTTYSAKVVSHNLIER